MFLNELSEPQKSTFIALATRIILADGKVKEEENVLLESMRAEMGDPAKAPAEEFFGAVNTQHFEGQRRAKYIALLELFVISYADESLHEEESRVVDEVRESFGIDPDDQEKLDTLAREQAGLVMEALRMAGYGPDAESAIAT